VGEFSYLYSYCVCITTHSKAVCGKLPLHSFFSKAFGFLSHYIRLSQSFVDLYMHILQVLLMISTFGRGYVALHQKKDPKLCSLRIFSNKQQYDEHNSNSSPLLVAKYQRWNCSNCLGRMKSSGHRTSETVPMQQDGTNDDCSISIVRTLPYSVGSRRLFSCTQQSSQGNDADQSNVSKSVQECNSKCSSPSDDKAVTAVDVPATSAENNVPDTFVKKGIPDTIGMAELSEFSTTMYFSLYTIS
jgi:hypothetical protein